MKPDAKKLPEWTPELKQEMRTETNMFFQAAMQGDHPASFRELTSAPFGIRKYRVKATRWWAAYISGVSCQRFELCQIVIADCRVKVSAEIRGIRNLREGE
jgi:hypothetical protein